MNFHKNAIKLQACFFHIDHHCCAKNEFSQKCYLAAGLYSFLSITIFAQKMNFRKNAI